MSDPLRNRTKGDPLPKDLATWNALLEAAREARAAKKLFQQATPEPPVDVLVVNKSLTVDYPQFSLVALGAAVGDKIERYRQNNVFELAAASATNFHNQTLAVLQRAAKKASNNVVPARIRGVSSVRLAETPPPSPTLRFLKPNATDPATLDETGDPTALGLLDVCALDDTAGKALISTPVLNWLAYTPVGGIPARAGSTCGSAVCTFYLLVGDVLTITSPARTETVRNLATSGVAGSTYIQVKAVAGGWVVDWEDCG